MGMLQTILPVSCKIYQSAHSDNTQGGDKTFNNDTITSYSCRYIFMGGGTKGQVAMSSRLLELQNCPLHIQISFNCYLIVVDHYT